jgi:polyvinyl alcohol dehydrogenase (cytochrome)
MIRKFILTALCLVAIGISFMAVKLMLADDPIKALESLAIRHADKLPLAYLGEKIFERNCATCHDNPATHAPSRSALSGFSKETVMIALEFGKMQPMAMHLSKREQFLIAIYLTGSGDDGSAWIAQHQCHGEASDDSTEYVGNWGLGIHNQRFVPAASAGIDRSNVGSLKLAWSLGFPKVTDMRSQPAIIGDTLYFGDKSGKLYALDRLRGCVRNSTEVLSGIRSAITVATLENGEQLLVFADSMASIFAVDPKTLEVQWQTEARLFDTSVITGSISYHDGRLFVPISSYEVAVSGSDSHPCCTSHGGLLALDINNGNKLWEWHATGPAQLQGQTSVGVDIFGPSGGSVWSTPAVDTKRGRIYFGTGENLTHPATDTSDAVIALDMVTGELAWSFQAIAGDVWNAACLTGGPNCPENPGGDFDIGASIIITADSAGNDMLLVGQKSGEVFALNPDPASKKGDLIWRRRISQGTSNGGIHWGMALSGSRLLVPIADPEQDHRRDFIPRPGLYALDRDSGKVLWEQPAQRGCEVDEENKPLIGLENNRSSKKLDLAAQYRCSYFYGLSAATIATPDLAFSAGLDGKLRAYELETGEILWEENTAVPFATDNGIKGHGGAIDVGGQVIADGWLYVQSGYAMFGQLPGNVLLAYRVEGAMPD